MDPKFFQFEQQKLPMDLRGGRPDASSAPGLTIEAVAGRKKFKGLAYSGGLLHLKEYPYPVVVDLAGLQAQSQILPTPKDHDDSNRIGETDRVEIHATNGVTVSGFLDTGKPDGELVAAASKGGLEWEMSIGAKAHSMEEVLRGETVQVNGRNFTGPIFVARTATLKEVSFVRRGADVGNTHVAIAASHSGKGTTMFEDWIKAQGFDPATLTDTAKMSLQKLFDAEKARSQGVVDIKAAMRDARRTWEIEAMLAPHPELRKDAFDDAGELKAGWTKERVEQAIELKDLRAGRAIGPFLPTGGTGPDKVPASDCWEAALLIKAGIGEGRVGKWYGEKVMNEISGPRFRGASISGLMFSTIHAAGLHVRPGSVDDHTIRESIRAERRLRSGTIQASGFTSLSMSGVLSNVANKTMIASYEAQQVVWPMFCGVRNLNDFKVHTTYRLDASGSLRKVGPDGQLKHISMEESNWTKQLDTYGAIVVLNRQMQINDDLGAFLSLPTKLGELAAIRPEEAFFVLLLANATDFFHANNKNLITGAGGVLTAANALTAITAAEQKFSDQVGSNLKPILTPPARMLCGTANYTVARNAYDGQLKISGKDQTEVNKNEHAGKYEPFKSAFVNNTAVKDEDGAAITGQSATKWWLFADPARRPAFGMGFLNGNRIPTIENEDAEFQTLGMQWRVYHDFGVGYEDPAGAVQINGA